MIKRKLLLALMTLITFLELGSVYAKADPATAQNMIPVLWAMYHVDEAEAILNTKKEALAACRKNKAGAVETAAAQAAVNDAVNLVNTLNAMITRDTIIITAAPSGVVNPPSFATNSFAAQGAWNDYLYREKTGHVMVFPAAAVPSPSKVAFASKAFSMYK